MEDTKRRGNPNFGKKTEETEEKEGKKEFVNCLRNEKIEVRIVPRSDPNNVNSQNTSNPRHLLSDGMMEGAKITFTVPRRPTGQFVNVLTDEEKDFLEHVMGLEPNAMSVYKKDEINFWSDANPDGINKVILEKRNNILDLSTPVGYIKYKILLANSDRICKSVQELQDRPKETYKYVLVSESTEADLAESQLTTTQQCWAEYGKISTDKEVLAYLVEKYLKRPFAIGTSTLIQLQTKVYEYIQNQPKMFLTNVTDKHLRTHVLIKKAIDKGVIATRNQLLYYRKDNLPLCNNGQEATRSVAAAFLDDPVNQELKLAIESECKTEQSN